MIIFIFIFFSLPYFMFSTALEYAASSQAIRRSLKKDIILSIAPVLYDFTSDNTVLISGAWTSVIYSISIFDGSFLSIIAFPTISFFSLHFIRIAFFGHSPQFSAIQLVLFVFLFYFAIIYSMSNEKIVLFNTQPPILIINFIGVMYFVFIGACHTILSKLFFISSVVGFILSIVNEGSLYTEKYFLILHLLPKFSEKIEFIIAMVSAAISAYNYCNERGWFLFLSNTAAPNH